MNIKLTKEEYHSLIEMLQIADWVLHAHKSDETEITHKYRALEQKIFGYAKGFGFAHLIEYVKEHKMYFPTRELEEKSDFMDHIQAFENDSFWDELIERLVDRDLRRDLGEEAYDSLDLVARFEKRDPYEERYAREFHENGLDRLNILEVHHD
jgi:hypothetical protein